MMPYLDWAMVLITAFSCCSMLFESPWPTTGENLVFNNLYLQICEYIFVFAMTLELLFKVAANGLFFTTHAVVSLFEYLVYIMLGVLRSVTLAA